MDLDPEKGPASSKQYFSTTHDINIRTHAVTRNAEVATPSRPAASGWGQGKGLFPHHYLLLVLLLRIVSLFLCLCCHSRRVRDNHLWRVRVVLVGRVISEIFKIMRLILQTPVIRI